MPLPHEEEQSLETRLVATLHIGDVVYAKPTPTCKGPPLAQRALPKLDPHE